LQNSSGFFEQVIVELLVVMDHGGSLRNAATQLGRSGDLDDPATAVLMESSTRTG
jgi:restriction endonuclease Mrr